MRTDVSVISDENLKELELIFSHEKPRPYFIMGSGCAEVIRKVRFMPNRTFTFISRIESWCLSLNSRDARRLNTSYWICMALCCTSFIICPWYLFLAFLIPALTLNHMRVLRELWKNASNSHFGPSTSGT